MQLRCTRAVIFLVSCAIKLATLYISNISVWLSVLLEDARFQRNSTQKIVDCGLSIGALTSLANGVLKGKETNFLKVANSVP